MRDQANFWPEVKTLLDWGFKADAVATPVGELVGPYVPTPTAAADAEPSRGGRSRAGGGGSGRRAEGRSAPGRRRLGRRHLQPS